MTRCSSLVTEPWFSAPPATDEMMRALDWPSELMPVQDAYWLAQREWEKLDHAYKLVAGYLLSRASHSQEGSDG